MSRQHQARSRRQIGEGGSLTLPRTMTGGTTIPNPGSTARAESLALVNPAPLMERTSGRPAITVGLLDGRVVTGLSSFANENIHQATGSSIACSPAGDATWWHATFVAGVLSARSRAPAILPGCTLLARLIFRYFAVGDGDSVPRAPPVYRGCGTSPGRAAMHELTELGLRCRPLPSAMEPIQPNRRPQPNLPLTLLSNCLTGTRSVVSVSCWQMPQRLRS